MKAVWIAILWCLTLGTTTAIGVAQSGPPFPDVFLITIDTLRADHLHCYGSNRVQTPTLDNLSEEGIRFSQAFTPSPITNTSHATILTGLLPSFHGVTDFGVPLATTLPTAAVLLKGRGYRTAAFIGSVILDSRSLAPGFDRGFDFYDNFPEHSSSKTRWDTVERRGMTVVQHAEAWLSSHPAGARFVWVHLYDPHDPYEPPPPFSRIYKDDLYDGEIAYADSVLGKFVRYLKSHGWYENSVVVVVGDHGEGLGEHNEKTHGIFLYDSTTHVPLILKLPGRLDRGRVVGQQVRTTDVLPTILDVVKIPAPSFLNGKSLMPYLASTDLKGRTAFGETDYPLRFGWSQLRSVRTDEFKFIEAPRSELYDLHADPAELHNEYEPRNVNAQKLRELLAEIGARPRSAEPSAAMVSQSISDKARAPGYLGRANTGNVGIAGASDPSLLPDPKDHIEEQNLLHTAMMSLEDSRFAEARAALGKVLQINADSYDALQQLAAIESRAHEYANAEKHLKRARMIRPDDATAAFDEAVALTKLHDVRGTRDALEASLRLSPSQVQARVLLGRVYLNLKDTKAATDQFEAALLLEPDNMSAQLGIAQGEIIDGKLADALPRLLHLSKSNPDNVEVFDLLAKASRRLGKNDTAEQAESRATFLRRHGKTSDKGLQ
jgi:arylsulfatase A-like enzyme/cytochrome c-type biogenesis protein CcmH/NrfG